MHIRLHEVLGARGPKKRYLFHHEMERQIEGLTCQFSTLVKARKSQLKMNKFLRWTANILELTDGKFGFYGRLPTKRLCSKPFVLSCALDVHKV